jgi:hypothetical protein
MLCLSSLVSLIITLPWMVAYFVPLVSVYLVAACAPLAGLACYPCCYTCCVATLIPCIPPPP